MSLTEDCQVVNGLVGRLGAFPEQFFHSALFDRPIEVVKCHMECSSEHDEDIEGGGADASEDTGHIPLIHMGEGRQLGEVNVAPTKPDALAGDSVLEKSVGRHHFVS